MKEVADKFIATIERLNECESELRKTRKQSRERDVILDPALQESTKQTKEAHSLCDAKRQQTELNFRRNSQKRSK